MEDSDRQLRPPGWRPHSKPPDDAKSKVEEALKPFYDALEACPSDTKFHCVVKFGNPWYINDSVELSAIDKSAQGHSYWEQCKVRLSASYKLRPHGYIGSGRPLTYELVNRVVWGDEWEFSDDQWASIVNAVTERPVLEELEIVVYRNIDSKRIGDILSRQSALLVLGLRILYSKPLVAEVAKSIRKMKTLEGLVMYGNEAVTDENLLQHLFPSESSLSVLQTEDQSMPNKLLWMCGCNQLRDEDRYYEVFISLLRNSRLKIIDVLSYYYGWSYQELIGIFEALQGNKYLEKLDMGEMKLSTWKDDYEVHVRETIGKLLDLIGHDLHVEEICLPRVLRVEFKRVEDQVKKNAAVALKGMELIPPESSRVFLCGRPYVGKTQLRTTYGNEKRSFLKSFRNPHKVIHRTSGIEVTSIDAQEAKFSFWDFGGQGDYHFLHDLFIPSNCESGGSFVILCSLAEKNGEKVIINLDGRKKKATFKKKAIFIGPNAIKEELVYWLRFIVSNSKISEKFKPFITLVFTHADCFASKKVFAEIKGEVGVIVEALREKFENSITQIAFEPGWSFIDARSRESAKPLLKGLVDNYVQKMLPHRPRVHRICVEVEEILKQWNMDNPRRPLIKMSKFEELCMRSPAMIRFMREYNLDQDECKKVAKKVALALHDNGNVIHFESLNFVVVEPNWFCKHIMGRILSRDAMSATLYNNKPVADENGFVKLDVLKGILNGPKKKENEVDLVEGILVDDLIQVMKEMYLCYEVAAQDKRYDGGLFIPAALRNQAELGMFKDKMLKWQVEPSCSDLSLICYLGYRLECEDEARTVLTQGFFPRVQVAFMKRYESNANCVVKHTIISLRFDGKEVIVEYCGKSTPTQGENEKHGSTDVLMDGYIDVLVKSSKSKAIETFVFSKKHVLGLIKEICYSPSFGCAGVVLVESILNPESVKKPSGMQDRKNQAVRVNDLKRFVKSKFDMFGSEEPFNLDYDHEWPPPGGSSKAQDLLGDDEWFALIMERSKELAIEVNKQHQALEEVQAEVSFLQDDDQREDLTSVDANRNDLRGMDPQFVFLYKTIEHFHSITRAEFHHRFDAVDDELDKVLKLSKKISEQVEKNSKVQRKLFLGISRNIEKVMDFSIHFQQCRVPRLVYFTPADKMTRLVTSVVPGLKAVQVHLMCEHIDGIHVVNEQKGCELRHMSEGFQSALPYMLWGVRAISLLVKIGGLAIGAGVGSVVEGAEKDLIKALANSIPLNVVPSNVDEGCLSRAVLPEDLKVKHDAAEQWLVDFLSGKSIPDLFDLHRIRYTSGSRILAWVCGRHKREGEGDKSMEIVPV